MIELFPDLEALRRHIPNAMADAMGERPLMTKLEPYLDSSEYWLRTKFTGEQSRFSDMSERMRSLCRSAVASEAFRRAVPALDLVLTANGFAVAGNQNLTPASRQRVDTLLSSLEQERDMALAELLKILPTLDGWTQSEPGKWFAATLFQDFDVVHECGIHEHVWDEYRHLHAQIADMEESLAEDWMSRELMTALRSELAHRTISMERLAVVKMIRGQILNLLSGKPLSSRRLTEAVNFIRHLPAEFEEWHASPVAELFMPPKFHNRMEDSGYFF